MTHEHDLDAVRAEAAAQERAAIVAILEAHMRQLTHGHGYTGTQVLQHVLEMVLRRGAPGGESAPSS